MMGEGEEEERTERWGRRRSDQQEDGRMERRMDTGCGRS